MTPTTCPECGAKLTQHASCQEIFDAFLALEFTYPEFYGAVHFLTVACFMIQHGRYSDEALVWIKGKLRAYLEEGLSGAQIRQLAAEDTGPGQRSWKVMRAKEAPPPPRIPWSLTIADVATHTGDSASYCEWIEKWARATLKQM